MKKTKKEKKITKVLEILLMTFVYQCKMAIAGIKLIIKVLYEK
jgi:hypothetical protein